MQAPTRVLSKLVALTILGAAVAGVACRASDDPQVSAGASAFDVGAEGGRYEAGGLVLEIPPGAVSSPTTIIVEARGQAPAGYAASGSVYHFAPEGLRFAVPIKVSFRAGAPTHTVQWSTEADPSRYEALPTTFDGAKAVAEISHFSNGFVGAAQGITCRVKRRVVTGRSGDTMTCEQELTIENDVHLWPARTTSGSDPNAALATDSAGLGTLYLVSPASPIFRATDVTYTRYVGNNPDREYVLRDGTKAAIFERGARGGTLVRGCEQIPFIDVACDGETVLGAPPPRPAPDGGSAPTDAGTLDGGRAGDAGGPSGDAGTGVTCVTKSRVIVAANTCTQNETVETNVKFWTVPYAVGGVTDPEGALSSDSPGLRTYFTSSAGAAMFTATDATKVRYNGYDPADHVLRSGLVVEAIIDAVRGGTLIQGCEGIPHIDVRCRGTTTLGK